MSKFHAASIETAGDWQMPLSPERYDRRATLTEAERMALAEVMALPLGQPFLPPGRFTTQILTRLLQPLQDVYDLGHAGFPASTPYLCSMCRHMVQTGKPFWVWSMEDWLEAMADACRARSRSGTPVTIRAAAYLFCGLLITGEQESSFFSPFNLARKVFGVELISEQRQHGQTLEEVISILATALTEQIAKDQTRS